MIARAVRVGGAMNERSIMFISGALTGPTSFDHVFPTAGTVGYHCNLHFTMEMVGAVVAAAGGANSATVTANGVTFSPSSVTIVPGGTVHWTIASGTHKVTGD